LYDQPAWRIVRSGGHDHHIAPLRVLGTDDGVCVGWAEAAVEDLHVVAVEMDLENHQLGSKTSLSHMNLPLEGCLSVAVAPQSHVPYYTCEDFWQKSTYRVRRIIVVGDHRSHCLCRRNVPDISSLLVVTVNSDKRSLKDRIVEVGTERVLAKIQKHVSSVVLHPDVEVLREPWSAGLQWESRHSLSERIVATESRTSLCSWTLVGRGSW
jgi:hypothetical protein